MTQDIFNPAHNERITVGEDIQSFSIRLEDDLITHLKMRRVSRFLLARAFL